MRIDVEGGIVDPVRPAQPPRRRHQTLAKASDAPDPLSELSPDVRVGTTGKEQDRSDVHRHRPDVRRQLHQVAGADPLDDAAISLSVALGGLRSPRAIRRHADDGRRTAPALVDTRHRAPPRLRG